ncbi:MAG TPA: hypothetical protein PKD61_29110 [Polyangiaceae bacterium]|nr:hypothetical protein [Polyangiaceae bacterium]
MGRAFVAVLLTLVTVACGSDSTAGGTGGTSGTGGQANVDCPFDKYRVSGVLDGAPLAASFRWYSKEGNNVPGPNLYLMHEAVMLTWGATWKAPEKTFLGNAWFASSPASEFGGRQFFAEGAALDAVSGGPVGTLEKVHTVGVCAGAPVTGSLTLCVDRGLNSVCSKNLTGTLDGTAVEASPGTYTFPDSPGQWPTFATLLGEDGVLVIQDPDSPWGVLLLPSTGPAAGESYCLGGISANETPESVTFAFSNITRAGTLPGTPAAGALTAEHCFP